MTCLTENMVVELVEGVLDAAERASVHTHLHQCGRCRELVSAVARLDDRVEGSVASATGAPPMTGWLPRGTAVDRYSILEQVGAGSAGTVYAAYDPDLDRRVALKLLRTASEPDETGARGSTDEGRAALLREARVMARLSHPNVIAVHDVGVTEAGVFVAMEFVSGHTLREWREERERSWAEIRDVFVAAGRGLAAAHGAGLVHRDFKPDNVLIGREGRVRVTDFGLARLLAPEEIDEPAALPPSPASPDSLWRLTRTGAFVGTPAYMAPEQYLGRPADALSDQFSFCVALYEAAYGQRPFEGRTLEELREAVVEGRARPPASRAGLPAALARALERGLAPDPADRHPSMDALLEQLTGHRRERRRVLIAALGSIAVAGLLAAWWWRGEPSPVVCTGAERHLASIWSDTRKRAVQDAFAATRVAYAGASSMRVGSIVDDYASGWVAAHTEACRATRVLGEQSESALDLRMQCLASRRRELGALVDLMAAADATVVQRAVQAAHGLRPSADCADLEALADPAARPSDPANSARLEQLETELTRATALGEAGRWREALVAARALVARARELGHAPFLADVLLAVGNLEELTDDREAAARTLEEAVLAAETGHDDARRARGLILAANAVARPASLERGAELTRHARAIVGRLHDRRLLAELERVSGKLAYVGGKLEDSRRHFERALAEEEAVRAADDPRVSATLVALGDVLERLGEYDLALVHLERARAISESTLGPEHPDTANALAFLGQLAAARGRFEEALRLYDRAVEVRLRALGEGHRETVIALMRRGLILRSLGRLPAAREELERALRLAQALESKHEALVALCLDGLGQVARNQGQHDRSVDLQRRALAIQVRLGDRRNIAPGHFSLGTSLLARGRRDEALAHFEKAVEIWETFLAPDNPHVAYGLDHIGLVHVEAGRFSQAIEPLERAYRARKGTSSGWAAETTMSLAEALWGARRDRPRAIALMREAAAFWRTDPAFKTELGRAESWLRRHRLPGTAR